MKSWIGSVANIGLIALLSTCAFGQDREIRNSRGTQTSSSVVHSGGMTSGNTGNYGQRSNNFGSAGAATFSTQRGSGSFDTRSSGLGYSSRSGGYSYGAFSHQGTYSSSYSSRSSGTSGRYSTSDRSDHDVVRPGSYAHRELTSSTYQSGHGQDRGRQNSGGYNGTRGSNSTMGQRNGSSNEHASNHLRTGPSQAGATRYNGSHNNVTEYRTGTARIIIGAAPHGIIGNWGGRGYRENFRHGYWGYWAGWTDAYFCFPFYVFDPIVGPCYCSPWYYYPCLPAYVAAPRVIIVDQYPSTNWSGEDYNWQPAQTEERSSSLLDYSVDDIVNAFQEDDHKAIDRLIPQDGNVNIYVDGKYSYSLSSNDFYDTYVDGIESTKTDHYEIVDVKSNADGTAKVTAKHIYTDPWGKRAFVYHTYFLAKEGSQYVIREFGTSNYLSN